MYRIVAVKRDGKVQTWEPVTSVFTDNPMPTADIRTKREAIKEFNMSLREANADDYLRVHVSEQDKDGVWRDTSGCDTVRFFKQDERSIASIDKNSNEMCRLKEQIKEEYYNEVQDTES